jgi:hypothetical protein
MKGYCRIECMNGFDVTYERFIPGNLSEDEVATIIQRLACKCLTEDEVIGASVRRPHRTALLETLRGGKPHGKRTTISIDHGERRRSFLMDR